MLGRSPDATSKLNFAGRTSSPLQFLQERQRPRQAPVAHGACAP